MDYNVTAELDTAMDDLDADQADAYLAAFADYSPVIARSDLGRADLILSLPAQTLWQAIATTRSLLADLSIARISIESAEDFDRRSTYGTIPPLISITQAAQRLGMTRAGVQKRIEKGTIPAVRVGDASWAVPAAAVPATTPTS